jgi:hypothetical protein
MTDRAAEYLQRFNLELRRLLDTGVPPEPAELLAHRIVSSEINGQDKVARATHDALQLGARHGAEIAQMLAQGKGGKARAANIEPAKVWLVGYWRDHKHERRRYPSKRAFARKMAEPGSLFRTENPGVEVTSRTIQVWLRKH